MNENLDLFSDTPGVGTPRVQEQEAQAAQREARKAKREPSARALAAEQQQQDAQGALRTIYRQLAASLHPDREPDAAERERKNALIDALWQDRRRLGCEMEVEFGLPQYATWSEQALSRAMREQIEELTSLGEWMRGDLHAVQDLARFKVWLKAQVRAMKEMDRGDTMMDAELAFLMGQGWRR